MAAYYNDLEFKSEDAVAAVLAPVALALGLPIHCSLVSDPLEQEHIAVIAEDGNPSDGHPNTGNYRIPVRIKVVTSIDAALPGSLRAIHRNRVGQVRDALMRDDLADILSASLTDFFVEEFFLGRFTQRIQGRHWITEFTITLDPVCASDL